MARASPFWGLVQANKPNQAHSRFETVPQHRLIHCSINPKKPRTIHARWLYGAQCAAPIFCRSTTYLKRSGCVILDQTSRSMGCKYLLLFKIDLTLAIVPFLTGGWSTLLSKIQRRQAIASNSSSSSASNPISAQNAAR